MRLKQSVRPGRPENIYGATGKHIYGATGKHIWCNWQIYMVKLANIYGATGKQI